jgi:outer membrane lipoprotein-sorting protein
MIAPRDGSRARALIEKIITAKGGVERLRSIKNITATTRATALGSNAKQGVIETVTYLDYPNRVRVESKTPRGDVVQVFDGSRAWVREPSGVHDVPPQMVRDLEANLRRDTVAALLAAADGQLTARQLLDAKDEHGALRYAIELSGPDLDPTILYIDPETSLVVKQTYVAGGRGQTLVEELFSDYQPVEGLTVAFTTTVRVRGETVLDRRVTAFTINTPISPALFKRPTS